MSSKPPPSPPTTPSSPTTPPPPFPAPTTSSPQPDITLQTLDEALNPYTIPHLTPTPSAPDASEITRRNMHVVTVRRTNGGGDPPPYDAPPAYAGKGRRLCCGWMGKRGRDCILERVCGWRFWALVAGTVDLITSLGLFFLVASGVATSEVNMFAITIPVVWVVVAAVGRMAIVRAHLSTLLLYTLLYLLRWSADVFAVMLNALTGTLAILRVNTGRAIVMGGVVGVRSFYRVLLPCAKTRKGECVMVDRVGPDVGIWLGVMLCIHLLATLLLIQYTLHVRRTKLLSSPSSSSSYHYTEDEECPRSSEMSMITPPPLPHPPAPAVSAMRVARSEGRSVRRVVFADEVGR
ncbi:hypothetical protein HDV00_010116 [Rhizophlyctis rosea]|nr:hypothetical protein HDV00_010116 [Rhizophlyctis rosea]